MQKKPIGKIERLQLDRNLDDLRNATATNRPIKGWIKTIREGLGMTVVQLGKRIGLTSIRISSIEAGEINDSLSLKTLKKVAKGLNCKVFYVLMPEKPLQTTVEEQAKKFVLTQNKNLSHSMMLEGQEVDKARLNDMTNVQAEELLQKSIRKIWGDD